MRRQVVFYERVSLKIQTENDAVSIDQQHKDMLNLCSRNDWKVFGVYIDSDNYRANLPPNKGKIVNPSGERADRPQFLLMLKAIEEGEIDAVICWRDDRLVRHPRVAVALEDALDIGDLKRNGKEKIRILDATGAEMDRFTLSIKAAIWREENKRRAERSRMGKLGTLQEGRWPGEFRRYGYKSVKEEGKRGRKVVIDPQTAPAVERIFEAYASGKRVAEIREFLIRENHPQIYTSLCKHDWSMSLISRILRSEEYLGFAKWTFKDGTEIKIDIPQIIDPDLFQRVQSRMDKNKKLSTRNAKGVYLLQGLISCGDCDRGLSVKQLTDTIGGYGYACHTAGHNANEDHPKPYNHNGTHLDNAVWRKIVDSGLNQPDFIREYIENKLSQYESDRTQLDKEIIQAKNRIRDIENTRAFYQRKAAEGKITETEFDSRMDETKEDINYWCEVLEGYQVIKLDNQKMRDSLDYAEELFTKLRAGLEYLDCEQDVLNAKPESERNLILTKRQEIIRTLVDRVTVNSQRNIQVFGVLDGSESLQFGYRAY